MTKSYSSESLAKLEWWRGFLAFVVFLAHIAQIVWYPVVGDKSVFASVFAGLANISVVFFFVLSGILVSYSAVNLRKEGLFDWKKYFINRFTRIYPALLFVLIFCIVLTLGFPLLNNGSEHIKKISTDLYLARETFTIDLKGLVQTVLMIPQGITQVDGPLWSLFIEWWLYMSALFVFLALDSKRNLLFRSCCSLFSIVLLAPVLYSFKIEGLFYILIWYMGFSYTTFFRFNEKIYKYGIILSLILFVLILFLNGMSSLDINTAEKSVYGLVQIIYSVWFIKLAFKFSGSSFFQSMAKYSYTLYIIHFPIILFIFAIARPFALNRLTYLLIESIVLIILIPMISKAASNYTEDKLIYRSLFYRILLK